MMCHTQQQSFSSGLREHATNLSLLFFLIVSSVCTFILAPSGANAAKAARYVPSEYDRSDWKLVFDDEFTEGRLNTTIWNVEDYSAGHYKSCCMSFGTQYFTTQDVSLSHNMLRITSEKRSMGGKQYTSGALTTENKFSFLYGRVDISARLPRGQGMWPALWLLTGNADHEVDIMEAVNTPNILYQTFHLNIPAYNTIVNQCIVSEKGLSTALHTYSLVWYATSLTWYFDGVQTCQVTAFVPWTPMYLLLNTAVGGSWPGAPDSHTVFPQYTDISSVRVYQAAPDTSRAGLVVTSPLQMAQSTIVRGNIMKATVTYTNSYNTPIVLNNIIVAGRKPGGGNADFNNKSGPITLYPGKAITLQASRTIKSTDPTGLWYAFSSVQTPDGRWHTDGTNMQYLTVTAS